MADALVSIAVEQLTHVIEKEVALFASASDDLEKLKGTFQAIKAVLRDAEAKQVEQESIRLWITRLKAAAYDIGDVVDEWKISVIREEEEAEGEGEAGHPINPRNKVMPCHFLLSSCTCLEHPRSRYNVARRIKEIRERLDQIADDKKKYGFVDSNSSHGGGDGRMLGRSRSLTTSLMKEAEMMIPRYSDMKLIVDKLVNGRSTDDDGGQAQVVAIFGIGGLGKTTLAQQIYQDERVKEHFGEYLYWVCVSDVFDVIRLTKAILEQVKGTSTPLSELDSLQKELLKALEGKRFLLVLDDVWDHKEEKWEKLRASLKNDEHGSRILVTTRSEKVANNMKASYIHELSGLSDPQSWNMFSKRAFAGRIAEEYLELESVGREIVSKCHGVPLSIKVIGSAMQSKSTLQDWRNVLNSEIWSVRQATSEILPALLLTYDNLPRHLKQCFIYCSVFPKDWVFDKGLLVRSWVSQGFIESEGSREAEDIGAEYFNELVAWSMFQQVQKNDKGEITCKMHDLLHDLAGFIAKDDIYTFTSIEGGKSTQSSISSNVRHAFLSLSGTDGKRIKIQTAKKLRSFFLYEVDEIDDVILELFHQARFLRAMKLSSKGILKLPKAIGKMKHLRYLDLSYSDIVELPESVSHLHNLHTLNLSFCCKLKILPRDMGGIVRLRNLEIEGTHSLEYLPKGFGRISHLRGLCKFIVGGGERGEGCGIDELQRLNSLQGSLEILHLERVSSPREAEKAGLQNKPGLGRLVLTATERYDVERDWKMDSVLEHLRPHANLKELVISCYSSPQLPNWIKAGSSSLQNLTMLKINGFIHCEILPGLGKLPALKSLEIWNVGVKKVGQEFYYGNSSGSSVISASSFPKLEELFLCFLYGFEKWELMPLEAANVSSPAVMSCLSTLELRYCPKLEELPHQLIDTHLKHLRIEGCEAIKGIGSSSLPHLETFILSDSSEFFSNGLPAFSGLKAFNIYSLRNETLPEVGWELLVALETLEIGNCNELKSLPDGWTQLCSLENLIISSCKKLESLPEGLGQLKKLKSLTVDELKEVAYLPDSLGQLESLEKLEIEGLEKLQLLPEGLGRLKNLKSLRIDGGLKALTCLPDSLGELDSLNYLHIGDCEILKTLPDGLGQLKALNLLKIANCESLKSLPHTLPQLSLVQRLDIYNCQLLSRRCHRGGGDWSKISHIPEIVVDGVSIQFIKNKK